MRKTVYLAVCLLTLYLAGIYGAPAIAALALGELLLLPAAFLLSCILSKKLEICIEAGEQGKAGGEAVCAVSAVNRGRLPAGCFQLRFAWSYPSGKKRGRTLQMGPIDGKGRISAETSLPAPRCGIMTVELRYADVYDYLSLFKRKKRLEDRVEIPVMPQVPAAKLLFWQEAAGAAGQGEASSLLPGGGDETLDLREYAYGDQFRHIHWNQTARTGTLWVRERSWQTERQVELTLDLDQERMGSLGELEIFYRVLYSLVLGIFAAGMEAALMWGTDQGLRENRAGDRRQLDQFMVELYRSYGTWRGRDARIGLSFSPDLALRLDGRLLAGFTSQDWRRQLAEGIVIG